MQAFRHKTVKEPFRSIYFGCVAANCCLSVYMLRNVSAFKRLSSIFGGGNTFKLSGKRSTPKTGGLSSTSLRSQNPIPKKRNPQKAYGR
jgi:hypothetical protein